MKTKNEIDFTVVLDIPFTNEELRNGLYFTKYLPREKESIEIIEGKFAIKIYFSYLKKHLDLVANDFIKRQQEIKRHYNISVNSLRFNISTSIPLTLYNDLGKELLNKSTEQFSQEVMDVAVKIYERIFDFARNFKRQFWLSHIEHDKKNFVGFFLKTNAIWEYNGIRKRLYLKNHVNKIKCIIDTELDEGSISKRYWSELNEFLQANSKSKTEQVFLSNSFFYLAHNQTRMAIIEAVIALEHTIKKNNCETIKKYIPEDEFTYIKKLFLKKNQFSIPFGLTVTKMKNSLEAKGISSNDIMKTIEYRNMIMHNSQKEINYSTARKCLLNIKRFIKFISL